MKGNEPERIFTELENILKELPYEDPPAGIPEAVLRSLAPKKIGWIRRIYRWAVTPRSIAVAPIRLAFAAVGVLLLGWVAAYFVGLPQGFRLGSGSEVNDLVPVVLTLKYPNARSVSVIGSFNHWNPKGYEMKYSDELGAWVLKIKLHRGIHEYVYVIDGKEVLPDPQAIFFKDDEFGQKNSVLFVDTKDDQVL
jgi:hypothetical protein